MARILIVDDEPSLQRLLRRSLEDADHSVWTAKNGREGLRVLAVSKADLVLLDMNMPEMDGLAFLRLLRSVRPSLPVIAMSGDVLYLDGPGPLDAAAALGAVTTLQKPFGLEALERAVTDALA